MIATAVLVKAYVEDQLTLGSEQQQLFGVLEPLRLFAPDLVVERAEAVMASIVGTALEPPADLRGLTIESLQSDARVAPLKAFSKAWREDLEGVHNSSG